MQSSWIESARMREMTIAILATVMVIFFVVWLFVWRSYRGGRTAQDEYKKTLGSISFVLYLAFLYLTAELRNWGVPAWFMLRLALWTTAIAFTLGSIPQIVSKLVVGIRATGWRYNSFSVLLFAVLVALIPWLLQHFALAARHPMSPRVHYAMILLGLLAGICMLWLRWRKPLFAETGGAASPEIG